MLYPWLSARRHLYMAELLWSDARDSSCAVDAFGLEGYACVAVGRLSQGMAQMVRLACAYTSGAELMLLDEPMNALDTLNVDRCSSVLREVCADGGMVLMSSHALSNVDALCDQVLFLKDHALHVVCGERGACLFHGDNADEDDIDCRSCAYRALCWRKSPAFNDLLRREAPAIHGATYM